MGGGGGEGRDEGFLPCRRAGRVSGATGGKTAMRAGPEWCARNCSSVASDDDSYEAGRLTKMCYQSCGYESPIEVGPMPELAVGHTSFDQLVQSAKKYSKGDREEQRLNYAYSDARLDGLPVAMASIVYSYGDNTNQPEDRLELVESAEITRNLLRQFDFIVDFVYSKAESAKALCPIDVSTIQSMHSITMEGILSESGAFRGAPIHIMGNDVEIPPPTDVPELMVAFENQLRSRWLTSTAPHLAAFALWRLLWIHPFADGNGRTARALAYLILCLKAGFPLPGTPTLPELLASNRAEYYSALKSADESYGRGREDVSALRKLIEKLAARQLANEPAMTASAAVRFQNLLTERIDGAPDDISEACFGTHKAHWKLWDLGKCFVLLVGSREMLLEATRRQRNLGTPVPGLVAVESNRAIFRMAVGQKIGFISDQHSDVSQRPLLFLEAGQGITAANLRLLGTEAGDYQLTGAAYLVRPLSGEGASSIDVYFDLLLTKHISISRSKIGA